MPDLQIGIALYELKGIAALRRLSRQLQRGGSDEVQKWEVKIPLEIQEQAQAQGYDDSRGTLTLKHTYSSVPAGYTGSTRHPTSWWCLVLVPRAKVLWFTYRIGGKIPLQLTYTKIPLQLTYTKIPLQLTYMHTKIPLQLTYTKIPLQLTYTNTAL
jgi:hypothetical protein